MTSDSQSPPIKKFDSTRRQRIAPCEERARRHLELLSVLEKVDKPKYWETFGRIARADYWFFLRYVLNYQWCDPWLHGEEVCAFLQENEGQEMMILMPRGTGKTGSITIPRPAYWLARNPLVTCCICNANEDKAAAMVKATAAIIDKNENYKSCFPLTRRGNVWSPGAGFFIDVAAVSGGDASVERVDPSLMTYGVRGNITGSHWSGGLILDDLLNAEMARHPSGLLLSEAFYNEALNTIDPGRELIVCGTRWRYGDFYGKIQSGEITGKRGPLKTLKLGITRETSDGQVEIIWPQTKYFDQHIKQDVLVGFSWKEIQQLKKKPHFSALYYNEPVQDEDRKFDTANIRTFKVPPFDTGPVRAVYVEAESQSRALVQTIRDMMKTEGRQFYLEGVTSARIAKDERILTALQPLIADSRFYLREDLWRRPDNIGEEIRCYDKGYDDAIDAAAYAAKLAQPGRDGQPPPVYITVDPAFTANRQSDYTAIVAACYFENDFYILDCERFQTDRVDVIARNIFKVFQRWHERAVSRESKKKPMRGFRSTGSTSSRPARGIRFKEMDVVFDTSGLTERKRHGY